MTTNLQILIGNLGGDPETHTFSNGEKITRFSVATTESWKDKNTGQKKELTQWHNLVARKHFSDIAEKYLKKGSKVYVQGVTRFRTYDQAGVSRKVTEVHIEKLTMLSSSKEPRGTALDNVGNQAQINSTQGEPDDLPF